LIKQFEVLLDKIDLDEIGIKHVQRGILGSIEKIEVKDIDIRNYAKYILRDGKDFEKRGLLGCLCYIILHTLIAN
jgi:hypothetical protein